MSTTSEYFETLRGRSIAVIGMGVSNTPLIRMLLRAELKVTVCDKSPRERVEEQASELEVWGPSCGLGLTIWLKFIRRTLFSAPLASVQIRRS